MADYQVDKDTGLRVGTEFDSMIPTQIGLEDIDLLNKNAGPLALFLKKRKKRATVRGFTVTYHQDVLAKYESELRQGHAAGATTWKLKVGDGVYARPWARLHNLNKNVTAHVKTRSTDDVTVRADANDVAADAGDVILIGSPSMEEGTDIAKTLKTEPLAITNYTENFMEPVSVSWHGRSVDDYYRTKAGRNSLRREIAKAGQEFLRNVDTNCMFNSAAALYASSGQTYPTAKGNKVAQTLGWWNWHQSNADDDYKWTIGALTEFLWMDIMERAFTEEFASGEHKPCLLPIQLLTGIAKWNIGRSRFLMAGAKYYDSKKMKGAKGSEIIPGMKFSRYEMPYGVLDLFRYPKFEVGGASGLAKRFAILDSSRIGYAPYANMNDLFVELTKNKGNTDQIDHRYWFDCFSSVYTNANTMESGTFNSVSAG